MQDRNDSQAQAIREQETAVVDAMVRLTKLDEQHARQLVVQLCQGLNITVDESNRTDKVAAATQEEVEVAPAEQGPRQPSEQRSVAQQTQATPNIDVSSQTGSGSESFRDENVTLAASGSLADDAFASTPELSSPFARDESEFTTASTASMELQLGAGSDLQMSSLPETSLSLTEPVLSSSSSLDEQAAQTSPMTTVRAGAESQTSLAIKTKAIVDDTPDVIAFAAPQIEAAAPSIVDTAKDVTALTAADIEVHEEKIEDNAEKVTAIVAPVIAEETAAIQTQAPAIRPFELGERAATSTSALRPSHVVQPGQSRPASAEPDLVIDAELIPIDGDEDAIIIIDDNI